MKIDMNCPYLSAFDRILSVRVGRPQTSLSYAFVYMHVLVFKVAIKVFIKNVQSVRY